MDGWATGLAAGKQGNYNPTQPYKFRGFAGTGDPVEASIDTPVAGEREI